MTVYLSREDPEKAKSDYLEVFPDHKDAEFIVLPYENICRWIQNSRTIQQSLQVRGYAELVRPL